MYVAEQLTYWDAVSLKKIKKKFYNVYYLCGLCNKTNKFHVVCYRCLLFLKYKAVRCFLKEIFKRLIPHQCQSCFWSRRNKNNQSSSNVYTVKATIDQFNAVSRRVMSTVVHLLHVKASYRARVLCTWIDVAQAGRIFFIIVITSSISVKCHVVFF